VPAGDAGGQRVRGDDAVIRAVEGDAGARGVARGFELGGAAPAWRSASMRAVMSVSVRT
jgi:hypothetical protein